MNAKDYTYSTTYMEEHQGYLARVAEFPSLSCLETTEKEAIEGLQDLLEFVLEDMAENNEPIPEPQKNFSAQNNRITSHAA